ncbi:MAG: hypothetical protein IK043_02925 [Candidatus Methanomethylophilaceae archaeon]|nr:hypothetical protein [Candidatus Methanomethylophilaceae archaeon]
MSEKYITLAEVKDILSEEQEKRLAEAGPQEPELPSNDVFDQSTNAAMEHAQKTARITAEQARELVQAALGLKCVNNSESIACKIADILPEYAVDVRAIFSKERIALTEDDINEVLDLVSKYI